MSRRRALLAVAVAVAAGWSTIAAAAEPCPPDHAAMGHCTPAPAASPATVAAPASGTDLPPGDAPPPAPPSARAADLFYDPAAMARADARMRREHGGMMTDRLLFNVAEIALRPGRDGYRWDGEGWYGGDLDRLVLRTEGDGTSGGGIGAAEVQALFSRAVDPYFNLQAGVRQDLGEGTKRAHLALGIEGLAPYWFDVQAMLFLSSRGDLLGRLEATYDQRLTQRLILQPRAELNLAAQDVPAQRIGRGLDEGELGLRLRYEIAREFAPYLGVNWQRKLGRGARLMRARGDDPGGAGLVLGVRVWL